MTTPQRLTLNQGRARPLGNRAMGPLSPYSDAQHPGGVVPPAMSPAALDATP